MCVARVIQALGEGERHVPFRDSKVTRTLQTVLATTAPVVVIASISTRYDIVTARQVFRFDSKEVGLIVRFAANAMKLKPKKQ